MPEQDKMVDVLNWCASVLGQVEVVADHGRSHPGECASVRRIQTRLGTGYFKLHRDRSHWNHEVHGYEQWARAFGELAPRLLAVRDEEPLALIISQLPGTILEETHLSAAQEQAVWRQAGRALAPLHELAVGEYFGPCLRDGTPIGTPIYDAQEYVAAEFDDWLARSHRIGCLSDDELTVIDAARDLIPAFAGERPFPCHRDYCRANWLVTDDGAFAGVIDFEFAYWDVRMADFTRHPDWEWLDRPDMIAAFEAGYGRAFTPLEEQQRLVAHANYALGAIVWGSENAYYGFAREGRQALKHLSKLL